MNIIEMEDMVKGLPDQVLMQEAQAPSGRIPQFLALSEVQRRKDMRDRFQQQAPQATVKDQILQSGIAAALPQGPTGMPPQMPPQGQPPAPPMGAPEGPVMAAGGGQMPNSLEAGSGYIFGQNPNAFQNFIQRQLTPQRMGANIGLLGGALLGGPIGAGIGANIGTYIGSRLTPQPPPPPMTDFERIGMLSGGLKAPPVSGGSGGGIGYGGPTSYGGPNSLMDLIDSINSGQGFRKTPTVTVEEMDGMYGGGQVPYRMQAGQTVPRMSRTDRVNALRDQLQAAILAGATSEQINALRSELETLTAPAPMTPQAQDYQTFQRIREGNLFPRMDSVPLNMPAPDFSAQINEAIQPVTRGAAPAAPAAPTAATTATPAAPAAMPGATPPPSDIDMMSIFQQTAAGMRGTGAGTGIPTQAALKPYTDFFAVDPNNPAFQATSFAPLIAQQEARGKERAAAYEQSIKQIEDEMKRERLGAVLTTLGANLMAGEGAMGLERAGAIAQQIGKEMRQEVGAERRAAKASEDATSDRIFALNAQQLTADKEAQRAILTAQQGVKEKAFNAFSKVMDDQRQAAQAANQLAATLTASAVNSMRDKIVTEGANARAVLDFAKEQARSLKDTLGSSTVGMSAQDIQKIVEDAMKSAIITGYAAIGQAPPAGFESQIRSAPATSKPATGTTGTTASESDPLGLRSPR